MRSPTPHERSEIDHFLALDEPSLVMHLGRAHSTAAGKLFSPATALAEGKRLLESARENLHRVLCIEWRYCETRRDPAFADRYALILAVSELIARQIPGMPSMALSCLLFRMGLDQFCGCPPK